VKDEDGDLGSVWIALKRFLHRPRMSVNILNMSALSPIVISSTSSSPLLCLPFTPLEDIPPLSLETPRGVLEIQVDQLTKAVYKVSPSSGPHFPVLMVFDSLKST
jgi:hypothetical protein